MLTPPTPHIKPEVSLQIFALWRAGGEGEALSSVCSFFLAFSKGAWFSVPRRCGSTQPAGTGALSRPACK